MRKKEIKLSVFKSIDQNPEFVEEQMELPDSESKTIRRFLIRAHAQEKMREASKPLYLKRYE